MVRPLRRAADQPSRLSATRRLHLGGAASNWVIWQCRRPARHLRRRRDPRPTGDWNSPARWRWWRWWCRCARVGPPFAGVTVASVVAVLAAACRCVARPAAGGVRRHGERARGGVARPGATATPPRANFEIWLSLRLYHPGHDRPTRSGLLLAGRRLVIPPRVESALRYTPACALAAIIAPAGRRRVVRLGLNKLRLLAGVAGTAIFVLSRSTIGTIVGGDGGIWVLRFGFGL